MDFILKDEPECLEERIASCMEAAAANYYKFLEMEKRTVVVKEERSSVWVDQDDILYIKTDLKSRTIAVYTWTGIRRQSGTLKEIAVLLHPWFCYCSRSAIVNIKNVEAYLPETRKLKMRNGEVCDVSFRRIGDIKRYLKEYSR